MSGDLRLEDVNGTVSVGLYKPGNIQIDNRRGDVQVSIPPNTAIKVEARTHEGEIASDFDEIKVDNKDRAIKRQRFDRNERPAAGDELRQGND